MDIVKKLSRAAQSARRKRQENICPACGIRELAEDPRYRRDVEIKAAYARKAKVEDIANLCGVSVSSVFRIARNPLRKPKKLSRCIPCGAKKRTAETPAPIYRRCETPSLPAA